jgi:hypothetical protein
MGSILIFSLILALAVMAGLVYAAEVKRSPRRLGRRSSVPPELRRRFIGHASSR